MTNVELDRLWQNTGRKVASAEITSELRRLPSGLFDQDPRVIATLDDGRQIELFSFYAHQRAFTAAEFVGLTVDEARRLKFAPDHRVDLGSRVKDGDEGTE